MRASVVKNEQNCKKFYFTTWLWFIPCIFVTQITRYHKRNRCKKNSIKVKKFNVC